MMDYFFVHEHDLHGRWLELRGDEYKHLVRVLRKKPGEQIMVTDGNDRMYEAVIRSVDSAVARCEIVEMKLRQNEPKIDITVAISLLKNPGRLDFFVEKATEFGVRAIIPLRCERTIPEHEKHSRLEKIAFAAMKQCGRSYLPRVFVLTPFETLVQHSNEYDLRLIPHERTEQSQFISAVIQHHPKAKKILIAVGPEGGFTETEMELAAANGFIPISLGPRRLRSESAAISAIAWTVGGW